MILPQGLLLLLLLPILDIVLLLLLLLVAWSECFLRICDAEERRRDPRDSHGYGIDLEHAIFDDGFLC